MNKSDFSKNWTRLTKKYRCGSKIIGKDRDFIIESCKKTKTYKKNSSRNKIIVTPKIIKIANSRKVKMLILKISKDFYQPISKGKIVEELYPTKKRSSSNNNIISQVRNSMRFAIQDEIKEYRNSLIFPKICLISGLKITTKGQIDIDHYENPFVKIADDFLVYNNLNYSQIKLKGPKNAKVFEDEDLWKSWKTWHKFKSKLIPVLKSYNRSKGCGDYKSPKSVLPD